MKVMIALAGSQILYHIIDAKHAVTALTNDKFSLAPVVGNKFESKLGTGYFYMSTARTKNNDYFKNNCYGDRVVFVLDGQKINANYQVKPVNYWHGNAHNNSDETEDRVFANKKEIPCLKYVKEIHFAASSSWTNSRKIAILAKRHKIPLFQYKDSTDLITLDKRKTIPLKLNAPEVKRFGEGIDAGAKYRYNMHVTMAEAWWDAIAFPENDSIDPYKAFVLSAKNTKQQDYRSRVYKALVDGVAKYGAVSALQDFQNEMTGGKYNDVSGKYVERVSKFLRRQRMTEEELLTHLADKFSAYAKNKVERAKAAAKAKYPHTPTFRIYKTDTGFRLEVENYPELNRESDDVYVLTDFVYKFHKDTGGIYDRYDARIEQMF